MRRLFVFLLICQFASATVLQVGSGQPFLTVQSCINAMAAGDICNVHSGTYTEQLTFPTAGTVGNLKTIRNNAGDTVTIQSTATPVVALKSYVAFSGDLASRFTVQYTGSGANPTVFNNFHGTNIDGTQLSNITVKITGGSGAGFCGSIADSDLLSISGTTCNITAAGGSHDGWDLLFASHLNFDGNLVFGTPACSVANTLEDGLVTSGTNLTITDNVVHDGCSFNNHPDAIVIQGDGDRVGNPTDSVLAARNTLYDFTQGLYSDAIHAAMTNILAENNLIYETAGYRYGGLANQMNGIVLDGESLAGPTWDIQVGVYNNTIAVAQITLYCLRLGASTAITAQNNVFFQPKFTGIFINGPGVSLDWDYYSQGDATPIKWDPTGGGAGTNYSRAAFIAAGHGETNSTAGTANLNADFSENAASDTRNRATNLHTIFTDDITGATRPGGATAWDSGAYQYFAAGTTIFRRR